MLKAALTLLRPFWPFLAGAALLFGAWLWHLSAMKGARQEGYAKAQAEYAAQLEKVKLASQQIQQRIDRDYRSQIDALNHRSLVINPAPIRVCVATPGLPQAGAAAEPERPSTAGGHVLSPGPDLSAELVQYGTECERLRRQVLAWQEWAASS